jgi:hypothetical protein
MAAPYVPTSQQLVVEFYVRSLDRALDFWASGSARSSSRDRSDSR